jgi:predicted Zn-dependent protease
MLPLESLSSKIKKGAEYFNQVKYTAVALVAVSEYCAEIQENFLMEVAA